MTDIDLNYQRRVIEASLRQMLKQVERLATIQQESTALVDSVPSVWVSNEAAHFQNEITNNVLPLLVQSINNLRDMLMNLERAYQTLDMGDAQAKSLVDELDSIFKRIS